MNFYQNRNLIIKGESENVGNLWLGDYQSARNKRNLKADGINAVVTAGLGMKISYTSDFKHKLLPLYDHQAQNIQRFFTTSYEFIDEALKQGNVLIHCYAGVSRSTTILTAFLMKKNSWNLKETLNLIKKQRRFINPNKGFTRQLRKFQSELNGNFNKTDLSLKVMPGQQKKYLENIHVNSRKNREGVVLGKTTFQTNKLSFNPSIRQQSTSNKANKSLNMGTDIRAKTLQKYKKY